MHIGTVSECTHTFEDSEALLSQETFSILPFGPYSVPEPHTVLSIEKRGNKGGRGSSLLGPAYARKLSQEQ